MRLVNMFKPLILVGLSSLISVAASAKETSIAISFSGVLVDAAACYFAGPQPIEVAFGSQVVVEKIDGKEYMAEIPFRLICSELGSNSMRFRIQGPSTSIAERSVLNAGKNGLGIALYNGQSTVNPNSWYSFSYPNPPNLTAAPIKNSNANLTLGSFSMTATLVIEYQ